MMEWGDRGHNVCVGGGDRSRDRVGEMRIKNVIILSGTDLCYPRSPPGEDPPAADQDQPPRSRSPP